MRDPAAVDSKEKRAWHSHCTIHRACRPKVAALAACSGAAPQSGSWSDLVRTKTLPVGDEISVRGRLEALRQIHRRKGCEFVPARGPGETSGQGCCNKGGVPIVFVDGGKILAIGDLRCAGDDSGLCCDVGAMGQEVVATGRLARSRAHDGVGWALEGEVTLCALPETGKSGR